MKALVLFTGMLLTGADAFGADPHVDIQKFAFVPKEITVAPGTAVTWTNLDETPHTLKASDGSFASKALDTSDTFQQTFSKEGDYTYFCTLHPFMTGTVHVRGGGGSAGGGQ